MQQPPQPEGDDNYFALTAGQLNAGFLAIVGVVVAGICGWLFLLDGIDTVTGKKETDQTAFVAQQAANGAILKLSDLPADWKATVTGEDDGPDIDFEWSEGCRFLERDTSIAEIASAESDKLYGPSRQTLGSSVSVFRADTTAADAFGIFTNWANCRDETITAFRELILASFSEDGMDPNAVQLNVTFDPVPAPALGDATGSMYRLGVTIQANDRQVSLTMDILSMQRGRMLGTLVYTAIDAPASTEEEQRLAGLAAAKLVAAEATLPDA
jgi:hypothetical protein